MTEKQDKVKLDDIIGIVKSDKATNSVELKKGLYDEEYDRTQRLFKCRLNVVGVHIGVGTNEHELTGDECRDLLNKQHKEIGRLKKENIELLLKMNYISGNIEKEISGDTYTAKITSPQIKSRRI